MDCYVLLLLLLLGGAAHGAEQKSPAIIATAVSGGFKTVINATLPDPALINEYLQTDTELRNFLLPENPPLQLIKCKVYLYLLDKREGLFNFYTADHMGGCREPPPVLPWPQEKYSESQKFWCFQLRAWMCSWHFILQLMAIHGVIGLLLFSIWVAIGGPPDSFSSADDGREPGTEPEEMPELLIVMVPLFIGFALSFAWSDVDLLHRLQLPDPVTGINPLLSSHNISLSLRRCSVPWPGTTDALLFDFYTGTADVTCSDLLASGAIYPDYVREGPSQDQKALALGLVVARAFLAAATIISWGLSSSTCPFSCTLCLCTCRKS